MCEHRNAVVLDRPWFMEGTDERHNGVPVDGCLPDVIEHLWSKGLATLGSCCGHGERPPSLVLVNSVDFGPYREAIAEVDDREFELLQWQLVTVSEGEGGNRAIPVTWWDTWREAGR